MKDGSDGETFGFKLKVVPLGFGPDGEEENSCVVEYVDTPPEAARTGKQRPAGVQIVMLDTLKVMAPSGTVNKEDLFEGYKKKMPKTSDGPDRRRRDAQRALEGLIAKRLAFMQENDRVSLTSLVTSSEKDWLA